MKLRFPSVLNCFVDDHSVVLLIDNFCMFLKCLFCFRQFFETVIQPSPDMFSSFIR